MTTLVVAEKPSVARDIAAVLGATRSGKGALAGRGFVVTWAVGHLVGLAEPHEMDPRWKSWRPDRLPMIPDRWPLRVLPEGKDQFANIQRLLVDRSIDRVVCATDAGREGELIFRYIYRLAGADKPVARLWISSLTPEAIREGFRKLRPSKDFDALADSAEARSRADWLVGMNLTRAYSLRIGGDELYSVGRVQTPTLAMIVERDAAIRDFVPEKYIEVRARFGRDPDSYDGTWFDPKPGPAPATPTRLPPDGALAKLICQRCLGKPGRVLSVDGTERGFPPPLLYDLTELQRHANRLYGLTAGQTLSIAQALYEKHKLLSYPRTDSRHLSSDVASTLPSIVDAIAGDYQGMLAPGSGTSPLSRRFVDDSKVSDHHAIIPTGVDPSGKHLSHQEELIFDLVCRRLLMAWHRDQRVRTTRVVTEVRSQNAVDLFQSSGTVVLEEGWKVLDIHTRSEGPSRGKKDAPEPEVILPPGLSVDQQRPVTSIEPIDKKTSPPKRFTDASLLTAMETAGKNLDDRELEEAMRERGLGTPATRAAVLETLLSRGYVVREGKSLVATPKGFALIEAVHEKVRSPVMTGEWEHSLQKIATGHESLPEFMTRINAFVAEVVREVIASGVSPQRTQALEVRPSGGSPQRTQGLEVRPSGVSPQRPQALEVRPSGGSPQRTQGPQTKPPDASTKQTSVMLSDPRASVVNSGVVNSGVLASSESEHPAAPTTKSSVMLSAPRASVVNSGKLLEILHDRFKLPGFRPHQEETCRAVADGHDALVVMPTGSGKSLCYQAPGIARGGTTLVISPLIALMEDQVARLQSMGFAAERIHSNRSREDSREACRAWLRGDLDFLMIAPERLAVPGFPEMLARRKPTLIAIDEAHCISQWGHDFRPDYRLIGERIPLLRPSPVVALTATATLRVQDDILAQLRIPDAMRFIRGFRRDNLAIEAIEIPPSERLARTAAILSSSERIPAIVYVPTRKAAEQYAEALGRHLRAAAYHAGLEGSERSRVQDRFLEGALDVVVATIAFGMGIDKRDIRTVVHAALPGTVEGYYQEIGRAGRDALPSRAILLYSFADRRIHESFLERDYPPVDVLEDVLKSIPSKGIDRETLLQRLRMDPQQAQAAIDKLWIHGGIVIDGDDSVSLPAKRRSWQDSYEEMRDHRAGQLEQVFSFASGAGCRMLRLVRHFGDRDDKQLCGHCDTCAPHGCVGRVFRGPNVREKEHLARIIQGIGSRDGLAAGTLHRALYPGEQIDRQEFERYVDALIRAKIVSAIDDSFEKDGKTLRFRRLYLRAQGGSAEQLATSVTLEDHPKPERPLVKRRSRTETSTAARAGDDRAARKRKRKEKALASELGVTHVVSGKSPRSPAPRSSADHRAPTARNSAAATDGKLVTMLRAWRKSIAQSKRVPAFRVITDQALMSVAAEKPRTREALMSIKGIGEKIADRYGQALLALVEGSLA